MKRKIIFETVYVETCVDTDKDNKLDLIKVYIKRPENEMNVPAVYVANPYMFSCNDELYQLHEVDKNLSAFETQTVTEEAICFNREDYIYPKNIIHRKTKGYSEAIRCTETIELECISNLYDHLQDRGYASVFCGGLGTKGSEGIVKTGSYEELLAFKSVIDWLNGKARAFTNLTDEIEVQADWCSGSVAMSAKSYLGTLAVGVATTGVEGLKTIIPEAAITNWYEYYRYNGLTVCPYEWQGDDIDLLSIYCTSRIQEDKSIEQLFNENKQETLLASDRESGNYNKFWDERNYLNYAHNIKASVLLIHGINDWNVKTSHCHKLFKALEKNNIDRNMVLHQGEHIYIYNLKGFDMMGIIDRWLDYYLKGIETGIEKEPKILMQSNLDQYKWYESETTCENKEVLKLDCENLCFIDDLEKTAYSTQKDCKAWRDELVLGETIEHGIRFTHDLFKQERYKDVEAIKISGSIEVKFAASMDSDTTVLSAMLVDLGDVKRVKPEVVDLENSFYFTEEQSAYKIISRGWLNAQNRSSIIAKESIVKNERYSYTFNMIDTDYILSRESQLLVIVYGTDYDYTVRSKDVTKVSVSSIEVHVPMESVEL